MKIRMAPALWLSIYALLMPLGLGVIAQWDELRTLNDAPAWVQALGSIAAIVAAIIIDQGATRRLRDDRASEARTAADNRRRVLVLSADVIEATIAHLENPTAGPRTLVALGDTHWRRVEGALTAMRYYLQHNSTEVNSLLLVSMANAESYLSSMNQRLKETSEIGNTDRLNLVHDLAKSARNLRALIAEYDAGLGSLSRGPTPPPTSKAQRRQVVEVAPQRLSRHREDRVSNFSICGGGDARTGAFGAIWVLRFGGAWSGDDGSSGLARHQMGDDPGRGSGGCRGAAPRSSGWYEISVAGYVIGNVGTYTAGGINYQAVFYYRENGLSLVKLKARGPECILVEKRLRDGYGQPRSAHENGMLDYYVWGDPNSNNDVQFAKAGSEFCTVDYTPYKHFLKDSGL